MRTSSPRRKPTALPMALRYIILWSVPLPNNEDDCGVFAMLFVARLISSHLDYVSHTLHAIATYSQPNKPNLHDPPSFSKIAGTISFLPHIATSKHNSPKISPYLRLSPRRPQDLVDLLPERFRLPQRLTRVRQRHAGQMRRVPDSEFVGVQTQISLGCDAQPLDDSAVRVGAQRLLNGLAGVGTRFSGKLLAGVGVETPKNQQPVRAAGDQLLLWGVVML